MYLDGQELRSAPKTQGPVPTPDRKRGAVYYLNAPRWLQRVYLGFIPALMIFFITRQNSIVDIMDGKPTPGPHRPVAKVGRIGE